MKKRNKNKISENEKEKIRIIGIRKIKTRIWRDRAINKRRKIIISKAITQKIKRGWDKIEVYKGKIA